MLRWRKRREQYMPEKNDTDKTLKTRLLGYGRATWKFLKWPVLLAVPIGVFTFAAWWSLISALTNDVLTVPDLRGRTLEEARFALSSRSLTAEISEEREHSQEIDVDLVLRSDPAAGSRLKRGRTVRLVLSSGFERVLVPDLLNKSLREAELLGDQRDFRVGNINRAYSEAVPIGRIIAQNPAPHTALVTETVDVLVSAGPHPSLMLIPDMDGKPVLPIRDALRAKGLNVEIYPRGGNEDISNADPFQLRRMYVYRQWPPAGSFMDMASAETIILRVDWRR